MAGPIDSFPVKGFDYGQLIDSCIQHNIPVLKKNGETYAVNTLLKKLKHAQEGQRGGAVIASTPGIDDVTKTARQRPNTGRVNKVARAILQDSLIQAYLTKKGIKRVTANTTIPLGIVMAVFGNQLDAGESGLGNYLPNFLENAELKKYWQKKGVVQVTPQTEVPAKFIYLLDA